MSLDTRKKQDPKTLNKLAEMPSERLSQEITQLAGQISAATCRMLLYIAEFDRRRVWADWGSLSCANWLSWKCGMSPRAARDHVRVARRLVDLPELTEPFSKGAVSYSKVRAIIRVATKENVEALIELANFMTAAQLEAVTSTYARTARVIASELTGKTHSRRFVRWTYDSDGSVVISARLDPEEGALVVKALEEATTRDEAGSAEPPPTSGRRDVRDRSDDTNAEPEEPNEQTTVDGSAEPLPDCCR